MKADIVQLSNKEVAEVSGRGLVGLLTEAVSVWFVVNSFLKQRRVIKYSNYWQKKQLDIQEKIDCFS